MSIYATLWTLKFPRNGDDYTGCEWISVLAQGVPPHIGSLSAGSGYEGGDPYASFLPPPVRTGSDGESPYLRAVVFITAGTRKGTARNAQEYADPLLVLSGEEYASMSFQTLYRRIGQALRGGRPRVVAELLLPSGRRRIAFEDGTSRDTDV